MPLQATKVSDMALIGQFNSLRVVKHTDFGLYLDGGPDGEILLPRRYVPADKPCEVGERLTVFVYLDSEDRIIATTRRPRVQVGGFANLQVVSVNAVGLFLDWGLPKDLLLPHSEVRRSLQVGDYCVVYVYVDPRTRRIAATTRLDRYLDVTLPDYSPGQQVELLLVERTDLGYKAIIDGRHWGLLHKNELFKAVRPGQRETGYIRELRADGKISLSLQPLGRAAADDLAGRIMGELERAGGRLALGDKSPPEDIARLFGVSKGNFKKAIGALYKQGRIRIHDDCIEQA